MSSVLETFYYLFDADLGKLRQGVKDADKENDKLKKGLGETDKAAGMVGGSILTMAKNIGTLIGSYLAYSTIKTAIFETAAAVDDLGDAADALDLNVSELSAWTQAAVAAEGTTEGFIGSLNQFNIGLVDIATKGKGRLLPFLKEMGFSMADVTAGAKDPLTALTKLADKFQSLTRSEAAGLGAKLGLDQGTINLLSQGRRGLEEILARQREIGVVTEEQALAASKLDEQLKINRATYEALRRDLVTQVLPAVTWFLERVRQLTLWMRDNKPFVIGFFGAVAAVLTAVYLPAMIRAVAATWALIAPYVLLGAAVLAFGLVLAAVVDDVYSFMQGNDSVIGELSKRWPKVGEAIRGIGTELVVIIEIVRAFGQLFIDILSGNEKALDNFTAAVHAVVEDAARTLPGIGEAFDKVAGYVTDRIEDIMIFWNNLINAIKTGIGWLNSANTAVGDSQTAIINGVQWMGDVQTRMRNALYGPRAVPAVNAGRQQLRQTNSPISSQTSGSIGARSSTRNNTVTTGDININTQATDAEGIAGAIGDHLGSQFRGAIDQMDDGVVA